DLQAPVQCTPVVRDFRESDPNRDRRSFQGVRRMAPPLSKAAGCLTVPGAGATMSPRGSGSSRRFGIIVSVLPVGPIIGAGRRRGLRSEVVRSPLSYPQWIRGRLPMDRWRREGVRATGGIGVAHAHLAGIGGRGRSGLAQLLAQRGVVVTGSERSPG